MSGFIDIEKDKQTDYNKTVDHPLQSYEWGEFRKKTGVQVVRKAYLKNGKLSEGFTLTIHKIPHTPFTIGYFPKSLLPSKKMLEELITIGKKHNCIFIQLEPNVSKENMIDLKTIFSQCSKTIVPSAHPLFTKYTFILDLTKSEEELLRQMHQKTRYNIKIAQKHGVSISEEHSEKSFQKYLELTHETTTRQKFYAHTPSYHTKMWETLHSSTLSKDKLTAHLLVARYTPPGHKKEEILATWILFAFHNTLYYPYGASSNKFRNVMASNLIMWEAIKFGKRNGLTQFDMWGALGQNPDPSDSWYGFHKFKSGFGPKHIEFAGSFDLIINPALYQLYTLADNIRWKILRLKK